MQTFVIKICEGAVLRDKFKINNEGLLKYDGLDVERDTNRKRHRKRIVYIDGISLHYIIRELLYCPAYRNSFVAYVFATKTEYKTLKFYLVPVEKEIIDYLWNYKITSLVREHAELDHTLSWLSTLGGAFSALGDYFINFAEIAGKISYYQLKLALRLRDPGVVSRCRLYFSLSLIQRRYFTLSRKIIEQEYGQAKTAAVLDYRLISMCKGIWAKLQYEFELCRQKRQFSKLKVKN